jgi:8-oxo-dGTP pyrophosphatase MutT (NUDIX family)
LALLGVMAYTFTMQLSEEARALEADVRSRLSSRLDPPGLSHPRLSDFDLNPQSRPAPRRLTPAAVLVGLVERPHGLSLLLTQRTETMPTHPGQIAFPGGRIQPEDADVAAAALREAREEVGLDPSHARVLGGFEAYETVTGYAVSPVVALVDPAFRARPDPREVASVFETPFAWLMDPANHERHERVWQGGSRSYYAMTHEGRYIWGATAGMIRALWLRLYGT